jgi:nucleotide-binding universal stress UspA family protein
MAATNYNGRKRKMYNKIIVPLDGSELAEVVLPYAEESVGRTGSELILISVRDLNDNRSPRMLQSYLEKIAETAKVDAEKYQKSPGGEPVNVRWEILNGNPAEEIIAFADKEDGSRIIMATHGQSGFTHWALGSVADKVSRVINSPITLIRAKGSRPAVHERGFFNKILAPLDGSKESEVTIPHVEEWARNMEADVTLLHVLKLKLESLIVSYVGTKEAESLKASAKDYMEKLTSSMQNKGVNTKYVMLETRGDIAEEINNYTAQNYIDLVVMATHGQSGPRRWVLGSVTNKVLHEGNTPIMLIRTPRAVGD